MTALTIASILLPIIEAGKPEFIAAIRRLRENGALSDEDIAATEAKGNVPLSQLEDEAGLPKR